MTRGEIIAAYLGRRVHVDIDRPIGFRHKGMVYPVNYGYLPGVMAGDGEPQDAYVLGVDEPLTAFDGRVIGVVRRLNDCEDKLVVAPEGVLLHQAQIAEAVHFQEQYFCTAIDALLRKSCGVIPYRQAGDGREYLILLQTNGYWSFPKGHMERGETEIQTALRELREETGLTAEIQPSLRAVAEYAVTAAVRKQVVLFLGKAEGACDPQKLDPVERNIIDFRWARAEELAEKLQHNLYDAIQPLLEQAETSRA